MSKRIKSTGFETRNEFDAAMDDIARMTVEMRQLEAERDEKTQEVQEQFNDDIRDIKQKINGLAAQGEKYALAHRTELLPPKKKSGETSLSTFGFRTGQPTLVLLNRKWSWPTIIEALKAQGLERFIVRKETPDKDAMKAHLDDESLAAVGCRVRQTESFWVEPKLEESAG